jgi:enediyne biosynthesis protein E4
MRDKEQEARSVHHDNEFIEARDDALIGKAFRWSLLVILLLAAGGGSVAWWMNRRDVEPELKETELTKVQVRETPTLEIPQVLFRDVTAEAGIEFVHENGAFGEKLLPETMGGGGGFWDYDNDGDQDILFVNSCYWPHDERNDLPPARLVLLQNDGSGRFTDVTAGSGLDISVYGMGVAFGDYDNDGYVDVFISAVGRNALFKNLGDGRFVDVTEQAGVAGAADAWSSSCGWFDYDRDGDLDLFVCNYVNWSREFDRAQDFQLTGGGRAYGRPQAFEGTFCYLYRNDGDGKFSEVSEAAGIHVRNPATNVPMGKSLAVTFADFDDDGWIDVTVANDTVQNFLFHNQRDGTFREIGAVAGVAFDTAGNARGAMGNDVARFRNNDALGLAIGNFANEMTALYVAYQHSMRFVDEAVATGLGPNTRQELTFGLFFFDYDLDGRLDLFAANGHLEEEINRVQPSQYYEQPPQLFWNCGAAQRTEFAPVPASHCGEDFLHPVVGRGAAYADIDNDGDLDVLIIACGKPARLLRNEQQLGHHWLRFRLVGTRSNRDAIGAWVEVRAGGQTQYRQVMPTRSYQSQVELPVTIGLNEATEVDSVRVRWPNGTWQAVTQWQLDGLTVVTESAAADDLATRERSLPAIKQ